MKFLCYDALKAKLCASPNNPTPLERFGIGAMAGAIAQAAVYPLEVDFLTAVLPISLGTWEHNDRRGIYELILCLPAALWWLNR